MLAKENYSPNRIRELQAKYGKDPILLERMLFAFGLLESLVMVDMPFLFKGGSCLMLLMDEPRRLSTDIDILVEPGINVEDYIEKASRIFPFKSYVEDIRKGRNQIVKKHFKFLYDSPIRGKEFYILLDVVFMESPYEKIIKREIKNSILLTEGEKSLIRLPSADCILGDKLTAFAPHTTGIPLGKDKDLEVMKQMYDVYSLSFLINSQEDLLNSFKKVAIEEIAFRGLQIEPQDILQDIIRSSVCIAGRKKYEPAEYPFYIQGSQSLDSHILSGRFNGEIAAEYACRVMYIAACLLKEIPVVPLNHTENYVNEKIDNPYYARLSHMRKQNLEAYAYLVETVRLLDT